MSRDERWRRDGVKVLPMPEGTVVITLLGRPAAARPGDSVDLYADTSDNEGVWVSGFVALSGVRPGAAGGPYEGEQVVWVGKAQDYDPGGEDPLLGAEWPYDCLRLSHGEAQAPHTDA